MKHPLKLLYLYRNIAASVPNGSEAMLFSNRPTLLKGEASQHSKLLKNSNMRPNYAKKDEFI